MTARARIIGLGQAAAGDDGVGLAVIDLLRADALPDGVELFVAADPSSLMPLLETSALVVVVDAVLARRGGPTPGDVLVLAPEDLALRGLRPVSTHGLGVAESIALARALAPDGASKDVRVVAIGIARPTVHQHGLSARIAAAVPHAAARVLAIVGR